MVRNRSVKFIKRTLNQIKSSIEINIIYTVYLGRPSISREITFEMEFT